MKKLFQPISVRADVHRLSQEMFTKYLQPHDVVYDIGCGQKPFADFLRGKVKSHIGVDLADGFYKPEHVDLIGSAYNVPVPDGCADAVISSQVIEHLETPLVAVAETHRILKSGGLFFLSFPFLYPIHAQPRDFMRYTEFYLLQEIAADKFDVLEVKRIGGFWYIIGMYLCFYLQQFDRGLLRKLYVIKTMVAIFSFLFQMLHQCEGEVLRLFGKEESGFRSQWTVNYVYTLRKKKDAGI